MYISCNDAGGDRRGAVLGKTISSSTTEIMELGRSPVRTIEPKHNAEERERETETETDFSNAGDGGKWLAVFGDQRCLTKLALAKHEVVRSGLGVSPVFSFSIERSY